MCFGGGLFLKKKSLYAIHFYFAQLSSCLVELKITVPARLGGNDPRTHRSTLLRFYHTWWFCEKWTPVSSIKTQLQQNAGRNRLLSELAVMAIIQHNFSVACGDVKKRKKDFCVWSRILSRFEVLHFNTVYIYTLHVYLVCI